MLAVALYEQISSHLGFNVEKLLKGIRYHHPPTFATNGEIVNPYKPLESDFLVKKKMIGNHINIKSSYCPWPHSTHLAPRLLGSVRFCT